MNIGENIKAAREHRGLTQIDIANHLGVSRNAVSQWEHNSTMPGILRMAKLAKLLGYKAELLTSESFSTDDNLEGAHVAIQQHNEVCGSMGNGLTLRDQPGQITEWMATPEWVNKNVPTNSGKQNLRIVTGFGDSMRGMFNSGDPLIVDIGVKSVEYDAVYFFRVGNEGFIKRLQRVPGTGLLAISENKAYESWSISDEMDFEVFGRVLKAWRSDEF